MNPPIKAFIQNEAGSHLKNRHNEQTLEHLGSYRLDTPYPHAYGFIVDTRSPDGENLDCYVISQQHLKANTIVETEIVGVLEMLEDGEEDHKVILVPQREAGMNVDEAIQSIRDFINRACADGTGPLFEVGEFLSKQAAEQLIIDTTVREPDGT